MLQEIEILGYAGAHMAENPRDRNIVSTTFEIVREITLTLRWKTSSYAYNQKRVVGRMCWNENKYQKPHWDIVIMVIVNNCELG